MAVFLESSEQPEYAENRLATLTRILPRSSTSDRMPFLPRHYDTVIVFAAFTDLCMIWNWSDLFRTTLR